MTQQKTDLERHIIGFFQTILKDPELDLDRNTNFIESGLLDSMSIAQFLHFLEDLRGAPIPFDDFDVDMISSFDAIEKTLLVPSA